MYIGNKIIFREKVSSTNDVAESLIREEAAVDGTIIWAGEQLSGRGQKGNLWESERGMNLTMSLILRPNFLSPEKQFMVSKVISLGLVSFLNGYTDDLSVKWPNDIYVRGDKIAGILIESSIRGNIIDSMIIGIGLNVNQVKFTSGAPNPVSMKMITGNDYRVDEIISDLCNHLNYWYTRLVDGDYSTIDNEYRSLLYRLDKEAPYYVSGLKIDGIIRGVDQFGHLLLEDSGGSVRRYAFREIEFTKPQSPSR